MVRLSVDLNEPKDSSKTDKAAQNGRTPKSLTLEIHHGGWFTPTPSRSYIGGQVSSVNVVDIDEFCLHDLKYMVVKLGYGVEDLMYCHFLIPSLGLDYGLHSLNVDADVLEMSKYVKDYKIILVYVEHVSSIVDTSMFDSSPDVNRNVRKKVGKVKSDVDPFDGLDGILGDYANTEKQITRDENTWKQMVVHVGTSSTADDFSFGKFKEVEVKAYTESEEESDTEGNDTSGSDSEDLDYDPNHDDAFDDDEHIVKEVHVNMNNFSPWPGQILTAVEVDANNGIYPVTYVIVEAESKAYWCWFLNLLGEDLGIEANFNYTFISDRQKFKGGVYKEMLWNAAKATFEGEFKKKMGELKSFNSDAYDWLMKIPLEQWSRAYFFREYLMKRIVVVQKVIAKTVGPLTPSMIKMFDVGFGIPEQWAHAAYRLETWAHVYSFKVNPCNGRDMWPVVKSRTVIIPSLYKPPIGRPLKKRKKSNDEIESQSASSGKLSRKVKSVSCAKCGNVGHNRKGCIGQGGGSSQAGARKVFGQAVGSRKVSSQAADQDSLNAAAGGNLLEKSPQDVLTIIENKSKVRSSRSKPIASLVKACDINSSSEIAKLTQAVNQQTSAVTTAMTTMLKQLQANPPPALVKAVEETCVTCGGFAQPNVQNNQNRFGPPQGFNRGNNFNHEPSYQATAQQNQNFHLNELEKIKRMNEVSMKAMQNQIDMVKNDLRNEMKTSIQTHLSNQTNEIKNMMASLLQMNTASTSSSATLPSNTVANPKSDLKAITTRSGVSYDGPSIPPPVVEKDPEATKDTVIPTNNENTEDVQPQVIPSKPIISEPANTLVSASKPNPQASILYPSGRNDERNREKAKDQTEELYQIFKDTRMAECLTLDNLGASINLMPYSVWKKLSLPEWTPTCMTLELADRSISRPVGVAEDVYVKVGSFYFPADFVVVDFYADPRVPLILERSFLKIERALIDVFEEYSQEVLGFSDTVSSGNPTPLYDPIISATSPTLTPFGDSDFLLEEVDAFLAVEDEPISSLSQSYLDPKGDILLLEAFLNDDPSPPPPNQRNYLPEVRKELKICEAITEKSSVDEPPMVELKALPPHLEYAFLEGDDKLPVIIAKDLSMEEKAALITVLKSYKRAIAWKLSDIKGINPDFCNHKILLEEDFTPAVQHQRRVNPKIHDVIKQEVIKLLNAGLIYPISDSSWVSPVHCVPKKGGFTVVENEEDELLPTRLVTGWRVCIDYRKLNEATHKNHFPLPFLDQMLERLAGNQYYCFLDGFSGYFQIPIDPKDQEKTTLTCPYGTFAYHRMPFGLCNAPGTFQRCMMAICHDMIQKTMKVFMGDFSVFGDLFQSCLSHLEKMLKMCEDTNLCLNWEKSHFMVKEGIVLGHKISKKGIEVDKAKIDVISKLPHPTTVKGIRSFLSHAGFYRRFIKDFSKIARPMTRFLEKDTPFVFS
nr:reverse transcriptase domain-containing protein [Tanacetum cinerariifolium]